MKNGMWRKIWIRDIEGIFMMMIKYHPENGVKEELPRIDPLTSRFPHINLDLAILRENSKLKYINILKWYTVLMHTIISYYV
jgi:hypothetical protein